MESDYPVINNDPLIYFFQDVARTPIVTGKSEYLLLTRRVQRARLLKRVMTENPTQTLHKILATLKKNLEILNCSVSDPLGHVDGLK
jgi:hypothetical protein